MDFDEAHQRLYPMDYRSMEWEKRQLLVDVFEDEMRELHKKGFVHRDSLRPSNITGEKFDNIFLTNSGLRLIDVGISAIHAQVGDKLFEKYVKQEQKELKFFREYFLGR